MSMKNCSDTIRVHYYSKKQSHFGLDRSLGFQEVEAPRFLDNRHMKVVRLSALRTGRLYPAGNIPGTLFCTRLSRPQGHSATERIMSMKSCSDTIGNRTRDLPVCSAVSQPTAPPQWLFPSPLPLSLLLTKPWVLYSFSSWLWESYSVFEKVAL
jgi:hypothetical protein